MAVVKALSLIHTGGSHFFQKGESSKSQPRDLKFNKATSKDNDESVTATPGFKIGVLSQETLLDNAECHSKRHSTEGEEMAPTTKILKTETTIMRGRLIAQQNPVVFDLCIVHHWKLASKHNLN